MTEAEPIITATIIRDHAFKPRLRALTIVLAGRWDRTVEELREDAYRLPPNSALCEQCALAEAAHEESTVER